MSPVISVIIPSYKPGSYLDTCLSSLGSQTMPHSMFEVLIVLNGEKEPWYSRLKAKADYVNSKHGIKCSVFYSEKANVSNARNVGISFAKGDYICFIDDDDYVSPTYLQALFDKASENTVPLCRPYAFVDGNEEIELPYRIKDDWDRYHNHGPLPFYIPKRFFDGPCMKIIHKNIIADRRFDERFKNGEDSMFMFLISDRIKYADFTDSDAVYYRRCRNGSAQSLLKTWYKRPLVIWNKIRMYTKYYFKSPTHYSLRFFCSRLTGNIGTLING